MEKISGSQKLTPFLWFDRNAEEAANFYVSVFKNSKILNITRYPEASPMPAGTVMTVEFEIEGQRFVALNGGPTIKFTPAVSFVINCADQSEIDYYWNAITTNGGAEEPCGWMRDRYGLSWQVVPQNIDKYLSDPKKAGAVMKEVMKMKKIIIADMERALRS